MNASLKLARTLGALAVAGLLFAVVLTAVASAGTANGVKPRKLVVPGSDFNMPAIDGTDVYWFSWKKIKKAKIVHWEALLSRTSLIDHKRVRLKRFQDDGYFVESVEAGGGQVVVNLETDRDRGALYSKVIRLGRDGSNPQVIAAGLKPGIDEGGVVEDGKYRHGDCGTYAHAHSVTSAGAIVLMQTVADRESSKCGAKPDVDHLRVFELGLSGATREIYTDDIPLEVSESTEYGSGTGSGLVTSPAMNNGLYGNTYETKIQVKGDRAIYVKLGDVAAYARDLTSGALSGPYGTGLKGPGLFNFPSLDPSGRVAMAAVAVRSGGPVSDREPPQTKYVFRAGIFGTPASPTPFTRVKQLRSIQFCGSKLIGGTDQAMVELDPITFQVKRQLMRYPRRSPAMGLSDYCTDDYFFFVGAYNSKVTIAGYSLK